MMCPNYCERSRLFFLVILMESSLYGDKLVYHGQKYNGRDYREEREFRIKDTFISFYFITRVYDRYVEETLDRITGKFQPDILIINSCLWDVTRWGASGVEAYKENLKKLMKRLKELLPDSLVIWVTTPPISSNLKGGFLVKELQFLKYSLRFHVVEANHYARKVVVDHGFDVVDSHYHLKMQIHRRSGDGIHWFPPAVRYVTNLLLTHISLAWNVPLPHRFKSTTMEENLEAVTEDILNIEHLKSEDPPKIKTEVPDMEATKRVKIEAPAKENTGALKRVKIKPPLNDKLEGSKRAKIGAPPEENLDTSNKDGKKMKSAVAVSSSQAVTSQRNDKENCDTPKSKSANKKRRQSRPKVKQSHHSYLSKVENVERHKRIRQWQPPVWANSYSPYQSPIVSQHSSPANHMLYGEQHDSGYFPSPNHAEVTHFNEQFPPARRSFVYFPSPSQIPLPSHPYPDVQPPLPSEPYPYEQPPLPSSPYPFSPSPARHQGYNSRRASLLPIPYAYPFVEGQTLQPRIDFTRNNVGSVPFGSYF